MCLIIGFAFVCKEMFGIEAFCFGAVCLLARSGFGIALGIFWACFYAFPFAILAFQKLIAFAFPIALCAVLRRFSFLDAFPVLAGLIGFAWRVTVLRLF